MPKDTPTKDANGKELTDADKVSVANANQDIKAVQTVVENYVNLNFATTVTNVDAYIPKMKEYVTDAFYTQLQKQLPGLLKKHEITDVKISSVFCSDTNFNKFTFKGSEVKGATVKTEVVNVTTGGNSTNSGKKVRDTLEYTVINLNGKWVISGEKSINEELINN